MGSNNNFGNSLIGRMPSLNKPILVIIINIARVLIQYLPPKYSPTKKTK
jgi:hypothetical protein